MTDDTAAAGQANNGYFDIKRLYLKDVSFESPASPAIFADGEWKPEINVQINGANSLVAENLYEAVLTVTITAKKEGSTSYLVEVQQAGLFEIRGYDEKTLQGILNVYCLDSIFPYAREAIDSLLTRGGFPPIVLKPINFNQLYEQQQQGQVAN